ncbi:unnamed protein product [Peronospora belbahrii]|uniref:Uncharacterized protein n=1 Tax=Peronospora belbahrii TaxID=622444 RepID=A0AAU9LB09_9STRA|nr:unnamed protein product [Peronospora belbahrii]
MKKDKRAGDCHGLRQVAAAPPRRRAVSNYQTLEDAVAERGVSISRPRMDKLNSQSQQQQQYNLPQTQQPIASLTMSGPIRPPRPGAGSFELLQAKFGFQDAVNAAPYKTFGSSDLLTMAPTLIAVYMAPIVIVSIVQMCFRGVVWRSAMLSSLDGTREQYIGRTMGQSWGDFLGYAVFWTIIFRESGIIESNHNIAFLAAMWTPVILVYIYDSQIWLAIAQAIVGAWIGFRLKIGHSARIKEFVTRLQQAPALFDEKVVSAAARGQLAINNNPLSSASVAPDANSRLRFAVVWNEIVSSFRLSDLLDDRETAILQYQISDTGAVEEPVFLIAGEAQAAANIAAKAKTKRMSDGQLLKQLKRAGVLGCAKNCVDILFQILQQLLGTQDNELIGVLHQMLAGGKVSGVVNLTHIGLVRENVVDLLGSILDLPEPTLVPTGGIDGFPHEQVMVVVQRVDALLKSIEIMVEEEWMAEKLRKPHQPTRLKLAYTRDLAELQ